MHHLRRPQARDAGYVEKQSGRVTGHTLRHDFECAQSLRNRRTRSAEALRMYEAVQRRAQDNADTVDRFYELLLGLHAAPDPLSDVRGALKLLVRLTGSQLAYMELFGRAEAPVTWRAHVAVGLPDEAVPALVPRAFVQQAIAERRTIQAAPERVHRLQSPPSCNEETVLCVPVGARSPAGVILLRAYGLLSSRDRSRAEALARQLVPLIPTVISADCRERRSLSEQVRELQDTRVVEAMARNNGNIAQAARELRVGRVFVYRVLRRLEGAVPREEA